METPNYYSILTADVRYSTEINSNEKILYSEITALTNKTGECWASNSYFADLYKVTPQAISKWINNLKKYNFLKINYIYKNNSKEIEKRIIKLVSTAIDKASTAVDTYQQPIKGYQQPIKDNSKLNNNTSIKPPPKFKRNTIEETNKFYSKEISLLTNEKNIKEYKRFVDILNGNNEMGEELISVKSMPLQVKYNQFENLYKKSIEKNKKFSQLLLTMENKPKYTNDNKSLYLTINTWLNNDYK